MDFGGDYLICKPNMLNQGMGDFDLAAVQFVLAKSGDIPLLLSLVQEYYAYDQHPYEGDRTYQALSTLLAQPHLGLIWLIEVAQEPIGYMVLTFGFSLEAGGLEACIDELYIQPSYRQRGLGRKALAWMEATCRGRDVRVIYLEVERQNAIAQQLYKKVGYIDKNRFLMTKELATPELTTQNTQAEPSKPEI